MPNHVLTEQKCLEVVEEEGENCKSPRHIRDTNTSVSCCFGFGRVPWCCKLITYLVFMLLVGIASSVLVYFVYHHKMDSENSASINSTTMHISNASNTDTSAQTLIKDTTTESIRLLTKETEQRFAFWGQFIGIFALIIIFVAFGFALCQRKVWRGKCQGSCCLSLKALCFISFFQPPRIDDENVIHVIPVEFNAWEYSGCEYLWAGIITNLGTSLEQYFGSWLVRMTRVVLRRSDYMGKDSENLQTTTSYSCKCLKLRCKLYLIVPMVLCFVLSFVSIAVYMVIKLLSGVISIIAYSKVYLVVLLIPAGVIGCIVKGKIFYMKSDPTHKST